MLKPISLEECLTQVNAALEKLVEKKHLQLPLSDNGNHYRALNWVDPLFNGIAPNYTLRTYFERKQRKYTADVCAKVFQGLSAMTEQAYLLHFFKVYWSGERNGVFNFQLDFHELSDVVKEDIRDVVYKVREKEKATKEEYSVMVGVYFLQKARKLGFLKSYGYFLRHNPFSLRKEVSMEGKAMME